MFDSSSASSVLSHKKILVGVCGGIAAYKSCDLVRRLKDHGAEVKVVLTPAATEFVTALTFEALSGNKVASSLFKDNDAAIQHIQLADEHDLFIIAPATADFIAKCAHGLADDLLSTITLAFKKDVFICPSMNPNMWDHPSTQRNIQSLKDFNYHIIPPAVGDMACGHIGSGRLPETHQLIEFISNTLSKKLPLLHQKILITAGPTHEYIDAVRLITSPASGKTGFILAEHAAALGAEVTLISGPTHLKCSSSIRFIPVQHAVEMYEQVNRYFDDCNVFISTAAVSDYKAKNIHEEKIKKDKIDLQIELEKNPDILFEMSKKKKNQIIVGFAAESSQVKEEAIKKMKKKNCDWIVANSIKNKNEAFGSDDNEWMLIDSKENIENYSRQSKELLCKKLLEKIIFSNSH